MSGKITQFGMATIKGIWIPLDEVGHIHPGLYISLNSEFGEGHMPIYEDGTTDDGNYTHVLAVNGRLVLLPETLPDEKEEP
jgi:hypothetical protein